MRCKDAERYFAEYIAGRLPAGSEFVEHLAQCAACRDEAEVLRSAWDNLRDIPIPARPAAMQPNLIAALAAVKAETHYSNWRKIMPYALTSLLIAFVLGGGFYTSRPVMQPIKDGNSIQSSENTVHYRGAATAPLTLVEYGDYECPFCATYNTLIKELVQRYDGQIRLEFHHFPLTKPHPNAFLAASAAEAAGEQGRYWEMNDLLFNYQSIWRDSPNAEASFAAYAAQLGLDQAKFLEAMHSAAIQQRVTKDLQHAKEAGFSGTPTFLLNGKRLEVGQATREGLLRALPELKP